MLWNTTRQLPDPTMAPHAGGQLFGVYLPLFNFIFQFKKITKSSKFHISINFTNPLRKTIYLRIYLKITRKFTKRPKTQICGISIEILDCLKLKRDICIKNVKHFVKKLNAKRFFKTILKNSKKQTTFRRYTTPLSSQNDKS